MKCVTNCYTFHFLFGFLLRSWQSYHYTLLMIVMVERNLKQLNFVTVMLCGKILL